MKIKLEKLNIETRRESVTIQFNKFNYFWGPIGTGKSTIARLILYCFGRDMKETPALHKEFISVSLYLQIEDYNVLIERKKEENSLTVTFRKKDPSEPYSCRIPARTSSGPSQIPDKKVVNMSDLIFYLGDLEPPKVLQSKIKEDTKLIRLGFRDLLWYCYLEQDNMDSSFFYLGEGEDRDRQRKSREVMNFVLGYYREKITHLEKTLQEKRDEQKVYRDSAEKLMKILNENNIEDSEKLLQQKNQLLKDLESVEEKIKDTKIKSYSKENNVLDLLKQERRYLIQSILELEEEQDSIKKNTDKQIRVKNEFLMTALKSDKTRLASQVFKKLPFHTCPKCGKEVIPKKTDDACSLCKQTFDSEPRETSFDSELHERAKELELSVNKSKQELQILSRRVDNKRKALEEIDKKIEDLDRADDSKFVQAISHLLNERGLLHGKIETLERLLPLPKKAEELEKRSHDIASEVSKIKLDLEKARKESEKNKQYTNKLKFYFLDNLKKAKFPEMSDSYEAFLNTKNFYPYIKSKDEGELDTLEFFNAGSGGKKTLFKTCFALALHRLSHELNHMLPSLLIIDSPMKNIHKAENKEIFNGLHNLLHELSNNELSDTQFIVIGSHELPENIRNDKNIHIQKFTNDINSDDPPLIPYYKGQ